MGRSHFLSAEEWTLLKNTGSEAGLRSLQVICIILHCPLSLSPPCPQPYRAWLPVSFYKDGEKKELWWEPVALSCTLARQAACCVTPHKTRSVSELAPPKEFRQNPWFPTPGIHRDSRNLKRSLLVVGPRHLDSLEPHTLALRSSQGWKTAHSGSFRGFVGLEAV